MLMADHLSLAHYLQLAATRYPDALALIVDGETYSFSDLLSSSCLLVKKTPAAKGALIDAGTSSHLARHAYACSLANRPFWPVDRAPEAPLTSQEKIPEHLLLHPDTRLIISTSGSEGKPRAVMLGNVQLDAAAAAANQCLQLKPGDLWLNCLPLYHIGGQAILWRCARAAAGILLQNGFNVESVTNDLHRYPVTHISLVPAMLAQLLEQRVAPPTSLRAALIGGAALALPLYEKAVAAGWPLYPSYGMSETAAQLASFCPGDGPWHEGLVGTPMPGHEIRINAAGRIVVRGPQVMLGYLTGGGVDAEGWLTTGDLGNIDATGRLTVTGRADDMLISGGRNIHPLEVESCLAAFPGVSDVAVTGLPDPVWGDLIVALIVGNVEQDTLLAYACQHLPAAALPRKMVFLERLPRNSTGKLERAVLRRIATGAAA